MSDADEVDGEFEMVEDEEKPAAEVSVEPAVASTTALLGDVTFNQLMDMLLAASVLQLVASSTNCSRAKDCSGTPAFGVACGVLSIVSLLVWKVYAMTNPVVTDNEDAKRAFSAWLFVWWMLGVILTTFTGVCSVVSNCWLATWVCFGIATVAAFGHVDLLNSLHQKFNAACWPSTAAATADEVNHTVHDYHAYGVLASAFIAFASIPELLDDTGGEEIFALAVGLVSFVIFVVLATQSLVKIHFYLSCAVALMWLVAVPVLTTLGPWVVAGNGWIASWVTLCIAILALRAT